MANRLIQFRDGDDRKVAVFGDEGPGRVLAEVRTTYELTQHAFMTGEGLEALALALGTQETVDPEALEASGALLPPIDHPDPAHLVLSGTGLTHLGSAESRDRMHAAAAVAETDSMRMFRMGVEGGKPAGGGAGAQPEWFYKGDGAGLVGPGAPLTSPAFGLDAGEEPEIAGLYLIDPQGRPRRLGYALANEFSDHVTERGNYLWLAHSKLRPAAVGPELRLGDLPPTVNGSSRIRRGEAVAWEGEFLSGEANMCHALHNLEHHHFKYAGFRRPGDVHVHFFGTATLSFAAGFRTEPGDVFEISADAFRLPLRNPLAWAEAESVQVEPL